MSNIEFYPSFNAPLLTPETSKFLYLFLVSYGSPVGAKLPIEMHTSGQGLDITSDIVWSMLPSFEEWESNVRYEFKVKQSEYLYSKTDDCSTTNEFSFTTTGTGATIASAGGVVKFTQGTTASELNWDNGTYATFILQGFSTYTWDYEYEVSVGALANGVESPEMTPINDGTDGHARLALVGLDDTH